MKKPVIPPPEGYKSSASMDLDDDLEGLDSRESTPAQALPLGGGADELPSWDAPMESEDLIRDLVLRESELASPKRLAARKRTSMTVSPKRLAARKRTSTMSVTPKKGDQLKTRDKGKGRDRGNTSQREAEAPMSRPPSSAGMPPLAVKQESVDPSARSKGKGKERVDSKSRPEADVKNEEESGHDSDIVIVKVVKREYSVRSHVVQR